MNRPAAAPPLLRLEDLTVAFPVGGGWVPVVRGLSLELNRGEMVGLVGESGCGKTLTALALMRLLPEGARSLSGRAWLGGRDPDAAPEDLLALPESAMRHRRGSRVAMIFQEPGTALNPVLTVGYQVAEAVRVNGGRGRARRKAEELLDRVALSRRHLGSYPHELSGGQRQRVVIAMALAGEPDLLLADEPTTALDVTVQARILHLLDVLRRDLGVTVLLITHDLAVVAESCERVVVMYAGQAVEEAPAEALFARPAHPYTEALLAALPRLGRPVPRGELPTVQGRVPEPGDLPAGCAFHPRCSRVMERCRHDPPAIYPVAGPDPSTARCFLHAHNHAEAR